HADAGRASRQACDRRATAGRRKGAFLTWVAPYGAEEIAMRPGIPRGGVRFLPTRSAPITLGRRPASRCRCRSSPPSRPLRAVLRVRDLRCVLARLVQLRAIEDVEAPEDLPRLRERSVVVRPPLPHGSLSPDPVVYGAE